MGLGLGAGVGWTLVFFDRFVLSVGFAAQYVTETDVQSDQPETVSLHFRGVPRVAFGVAF